jgi:PIN domain nuclease of toxin-antitoxin system
MASVVLDSSAVLAVINGERGADAIFAYLDDASVSAVNYAEVIGKIVEGGLDRQTAREAVLRLGVRVLAFDSSQAERTGELRPLTRHRGLSLGDRACLALAEQKAAIVVTADATWSGVLPDLDIRLVR